MADIDIADPVDAITITESVSKLYEELFASIYDTAALVESISHEMHRAALSVVDAVSVAEDVATPVRNLELFRSAKAISIGMLLGDWNMSGNVSVPNRGISLKGMVLKGGSGGSDVMVIKDGSDTGPYLYNATVATSVVLVYPGTLCKPYIDYSECTLTAGHMFTFLWE